MLGCLTMLTICVYRARCTQHPAIHTWLYCNATVCGVRLIDRRQTFLKYRYNCPYTLSASTRRRRRRRRRASRILSNRSQPYSVRPASSHICVTTATSYFISQTVIHLCRHPWFLKDYFSVWFWRQFTQLRAHCMCAIYDESLYSLVFALWTFASLGFDIDS
jgi:hypothetical protein